MMERSLIDTKRERDKLKEEGDSWKVQATSSAKMNEGLERELNTKRSILEKYETV